MNREKEALWPTASWAEFTLKACFCLHAFACVDTLSFGFRGGARNFPTEGLELPTGGGAKKIKKWCFCALRILLKFLRREPKFPPTRS